MTRGTTENGGGGGHNGRSRPLRVADSGERATDPAARSRRAVSYVRVSGLGQVNGDGLDRQRRTIAEFARRNRLDVVAEFADPGVSGTRELQYREGLSALLERVRAGDAGVVLLENASRLARDLLVGEVAIRRLQEFDVRVVTADSGTDLTVADGDPTRKLVRQLLSAIAEFDKSVTTARLRSARERLRKAGARVEGQKPYGTLPGEGETMLRARVLRRKKRGSRMPLAKVCAQLDAEGHRTRRGGRWTPGALSKILRRR